MQIKMLFVFVVLFSAMICGQTAFTDSGTVNYRSNVKVVEDSDKVRTINVKLDTLVYIPNYFRFAILGVSGNGDSTGFYIKLRSATP